MQIVMQLMEGPNICAYVAGSHQYFEAEARIVFRDITGALPVSTLAACPALHAHCFPLPACTCGVPGRCAGGAQAGLLPCLCPTTGGVVVGSGRSGGPAPSHTGVRAASVAHLHSLGISHRDLKPENLVFDRAGPEARIKARSPAPSATSSCLTAACTRSPAVPMLVPCLQHNSSKSSCPAVRCWRG